jgi:hypothetical protein
MHSASAASVPQDRTIREIYGIGVATISIRKRQRRNKVKRTTMAFQFKTERDAVSFIESVGGVNGLFETNGPKFERGVEVSVCPGKGNVDATIKWFRDLYDASLVQYEK